MRKLETTPNARKIQEIALAIAQAGFILTMALALTHIFSPSGTDAFRFSFLAMLPAFSMGLAATAVVFAGPKKAVAAPVAEGRHMAVTSL